MDRLTTRIDGIAYGKSGIKRLSKEYHRGIFECTALVERLADYEDAEEQGLLLRLPCKVGDIPYWIADEDKDGNKGLFIMEDEPITAVSIREDGFYICSGYDNWSKVGSEYALLTREEAEQKLKEMEEGNETSRK